ncbi:MAG: TIGR03960 family B12-binding radical SAM protein [Firmicutes bacterium]|nr:TIGR03960 family B12-binding radical SAM protein [Bacillota bacterium]
MNNPDIQILDILKKVEKPGRYLGNEWNAVRKEWDSASVRVVLAFPDTYEIGQSGLGIKILYHLINENPRYLAERVFSPWKDMEKELLNSGRKIWSLESRRPLSDFDLLGFTLQYEMTYTNILAILNLSGIPLKADERTSEYPLVMGGGPCVFNPEPLAAFFDFFVLGDGEEVILEILEKFAALKSQGASRKEKLAELAKIEGVYVPSFYDVKYNDSGTIARVIPLDGAPEKISRRVVEDLDKAFFPSKPVVPYVEAVQDRAVLEVFRGCTRGCRFCHAGSVYRPVRERSPERLFKLAKEIVSNTGYEELSLVSLNCSDYSRIKELARKLVEEYKGKYLGISLPSLRMDSFSLDLARMVQTLRRTGLTFAPEAGTQRMRDVINKGITEDDILTTASYAREAGWDSLKFYFMIGLPTETMDDVRGIIDIVMKVLKKTSMKLRVGVSPFVPKAHTPFQWHPQERIDSLKEKTGMLRKFLRHRKILFDCHIPELSFIEGVFSRGDRRLSQVLESAWNLGCRFDGWSEEFKFEKWKEAFERSGINPEFYTSRLRQFSEILPWDHLASRLDKEFFLSQAQSAVSETTLGDCRWNDCSACGVCSGEIENKLYGGGDNHSEEPFEFNKEEIKSLRKGLYRIRIKFSKLGDLKLISHLDLMRTFERAMRRANFPLAYTEGFHPRPRLYFASALSLGYVSTGEWLDIELAERREALEIKEKLKEELPEGIEILRCREIPLRADDLQSRIGLSLYNIELVNVDARLFSKEIIEEKLSQEETPLKRKDKDVRLGEFLESFRIIKFNNDFCNLELGIRVLPTGALKPDELLKQVLGLQQSNFGKIERTALLVREGAVWIEP